MNSMQLNCLLENLSVRKAPWAKYSAGLELQMLLSAYMMGFARIEHTEILRSDPLFHQKFDLDAIPSKSNTYRLLERFDSSHKVEELSVVNSVPLERVIRKDKPAIMDIDSTVNTVHGQQEGTTIGYNPRYHGRPSYQPLVAFEGDSKAAIHAALRNGMAAKSDEILEFYQEAKRRLPEGVNLGYVRADRAFAGDTFLSQLETDEVGYTIKLRLTAGVKERISHGVLWERVYANAHMAIEVGSVSVKLSTWKKYRRVVLIRTTEFCNHGQLRLFDLWDYQAIVTNLDWPPEDIWHFYNQRATCENFIKELKYGLNIDAIAKNAFLANAADLWLKIISYNTLLALKIHAPEDYKDCSITRLQRALFSIPAVIAKHARKLTLRMPSWWPYQRVWQALRSAITALG